MMHGASKCPGPWRWFPVGTDEVILYCECCGEIMAGKNDECPEGHFGTPVTFEGVW